jgi:integrase
MLALRVGEACKLKRGDFRLSFDIPVLNVSGGKSPGIVPIQPEERAKLSKFMKAGVKGERSLQNQYGSTFFPGFVFFAIQGHIIPEPAKRL